MKSFDNVISYPCDIADPETDTLSYQKDGNISKEYSHVIERLKDVCEKNLFSWKSFPVSLPRTILNLENNGGVCMTGLYFLPEFDECEVLSKDELGNLKKLTKDQLNQLRRSGTFDVESLNFPGELHTWRISPVFFKGTENIVKSLKQDLCKSVARVVINTCDRITGDHLSVKGSLISLGYSFYGLIDLFFGWPHVNHGDVDRKLLEERLRFLTCELSVKSGHRKRILEFWDAYERLMCLPHDMTAEHLDFTHPPYRFITPTRIPIDLRIHNSALLERCLAIVDDLRREARSGWFQDFKEHMISRFRDEQKSIPEIKRLVRQDGMREYASRLFDAMRRNTALQSISEGIAEPLIQQASFSLFVAEAKENFMNAWFTYLESVEEELRRKHPVLFHIPEWCSHRLTKIRKSYLQDHKFDVHEYVLAKCNANGLEQHAFIIGRDLNFLRDRERLLREQILKSASFPDTQFVFKVSAQLLSHWSVYREDVNSPNSHRLVDTVLVSCGPSKPGQLPKIKKFVKRAANNDPSLNFADSTGESTSANVLEPQNFGSSVINPRPTGRPNIGSRYFEQKEGSEMILQPLLDSGKKTEEHKSSQPRYVVQSDLVYKVSTRYFMWRWLVFFVCTYSWFLRWGQFFFVTVPFRSAFSFTALFKPTPIYLKLEIDQNTGCLYYNRTFYQDTLISRLRRNWRELRASRRKFDATPAQGMLDKAAARPLHWIWSYIFRGIIFSLILLIFWPPLCLLVATASILIGFSLIFLIPLYSVVLHLMGLLFWDAYRPVFGGNRFLPLFQVLIWQFLVRSVFQFILAIFGAFLFYPLLAIMQFIWALLRFTARSIWDAMVFHLILRRLARVPAREDCMVKRIAGPGTAANHFYQARPEDILFILTGQLELLELNLWHRQIKSIADKPINAYRRLAESLSWLSLVPQPDGEIYATLCRMTKSWHSAIQVKYDERHNALKVDLKPELLHRIKLSDKGLRTVLRLGFQITECFYELRIKPRIHLLNLNISDWWANYELCENNFIGLCTLILERIFGEQLFTCITEIDTIYPLKVYHSDLLMCFRDIISNPIKIESNINLPTSSNPIASFGDVSENTATNNCSPDVVRNHLVDAANDDDLISLSSDAINSPGTAHSQRCTVIAASSVQPDVVPSSVLVGVNHETNSVDPINNANSSSPTSPNPDKTSHRHSITDPLAFIHIDLPLFPLSAFAPSIARQLPLPLKSAPICQHYSNSGCDSAKIDKTFSCCICSTKAKLEQSTLRRLAHDWADQSESREPNLDTLEAGMIHPSRSGLATLLAEQERDIQYQISGLDIVNSNRKWKSHENHLSFPIISPIQFTKSEGCISKCRCQKTHFCFNIFGPLHQVKLHSSTDPMQNILDNLGRIYHPAIISLLMHSRDRENIPLDFMHPAIQTVTARITMPQRRYNLLNQLNNHESVANSILPSKVEMSVDSTPFKKSEHIYAVRTCSLRACDIMGDTSDHHLPSLPDPNGTGFCNFEAEDLHNVKRLASGNSQKHHFGVNQISDSTEVFIKSHQMNVAHSRPWEQGVFHEGDSSINNLQRNLVTHENADGYWSGMNTPGHGCNGKEYSMGTPTPSLYGTEDAATTDDLDESEDLDSLSSINQVDFVENYLKMTSKGHDNQDSTHIVRPVSLPLAIPELLTISATTAESGDTQSQLDNELNDDPMNYLECEKIRPPSSLTPNSTTITQPNSSSVSMSSHEHLHPSGSQNKEFSDLSPTDTVASENSALFQHGRTPTQSIQMISFGNEIQQSPSENHADQSVQSIDTNRDMSISDVIDVSTKSSRSVRRSSTNEEEDDEQDTLKTVLISP